MTDHSGDVRHDKVSKGFMIKTIAWAYAYGLKCRGYKTRMSYTPDWILTGAKWWVSGER